MLLSAEKRNERSSNHGLNKVPALIYILTDEPSHKRRKSSQSRTECSSMTNGFDSGSDESMEADEEQIVYGAELVIYDKYKRCLLTEGDYEVALQELGTVTPKKQASWETVMDGKV